MNGTRLRCAGRLFCCNLCLLWPADQGEYARAAALLVMGRAHPACPRGWWEIMALVQDLEARLQDELSAEEYAAAQAQGREMDVRETAVALLAELKEWTESAD